MATDGQLPEWVDRLSAGFCIIGSDSKVQFVNRTLADWMGRSPSELKGRECRAAFGWTVCGTALCPLRRILGGIDTTGPVPVGGGCCRGGCPGTVTAWAVHNGNGDVSRIVAQISKAAPWVLAAFAHMDRTAAVLYDHDGTILWAWAAGLESCLGLSAENLHGRNMADFLPAELAASRLARLREARERNETVFDEYLAPTPKGERWLGTTYIPIAEVQGEPSMILAIARDVSERKQAEQTLERKNIALQELLGSIEGAKTQMGRNIQVSLDRLVRPLLRDIQGRLDEADASLVDVLDQQLREICSPYAAKLSLGLTGLTPSEMRIASLIRSGMASKQIARLEHISTATVNKHREHIRHKLGISGKHANLASFLQSLAAEQVDGPPDQPGRQPTQPAGSTELRPANTVSGPPVSHA